MSMNKIKAVIICHRKFIMVSILLWVLISYSMFLSFDEEWKDARNQQKYVVAFENIDDECDTETKIINLADEMVITQTIQIGCEEFTGIALHFEAEEQPKDGQLTIELVEKGSGKNIETWIRDVEDITLGQFYSFPLKEQIDTEITSEYIIKVSASDVLRNTINVAVVEVDGEQNISTLLNDTKSDFAMEYRIINGNYNALRFLALAFYIGMSIAIFAVVFMCLKKINLEGIFVIFVLIIGMMYMFALPPFSVPDEASHFVTTYAYSSSLLGEQVLDDDGLVLLDSEKLWGAEQNIPTRESYDRYFRGVLGQKIDSEEESVSSRTPLNASAWGYFPQIVGVSLGRAINLNSEQLLVFGRLFALMWYVFVMYWAIKIMPFGKMALFTIGAMPMTMQMVVSYNYDSVLFGASFFVFAYLLQLIYEQEKVKIKDVICVSVCAMIIATIKFIYLPILGLALFIPKWKFKSNKEKIISAFCVFGSSIITILYQKLSLIQKFALPHTTNNVNLTEAISIGYILKHPMEIFDIFFRTFEHQASSYLSGMLVSPLGWLEIWLPDIVVLGFVVLLLISFITGTEDETETRGWLCPFCWLLAGVMVVLCLVAILCDCTSVGAKQIAGFQGRYWLPILPMAIIMLKNKVFVVKKNIDSYLILGLSYLHCVSIFYITLTIVNR